MWNNSENKTPHNRSTLLKLTHKHMHLQRSIWYIRNEPSLIENPTFMIDGLPTKSTLWCTCIHKLSACVHMHIYTFASKHIPFHHLEKILHACVHIYTHMYSQLYIYNYIYSDIYILYIQINILCPGHAFSSQCHPNQLMAWREGWRIRWSFRKRMSCREQRDQEEK